jgi:photoactive yellow protein
MFSPATMPTVPSEATVRTPSFSDPHLHAWLDAATPEALDQLEFGVIGFDDKGVVNRYNTFESRAAGLSLERVQGNPLFTVVAPCMNNFMVAQRFEDAHATGSELDATVDYVLTLRMRPVKVRLRLLAAPGSATRYVIVERRV